MVLKLGMVHLVLEFYQNCSNDDLELTIKLLKFYLLKLVHTVSLCLQYFLGYKTELFSFQNNSKNLDISCKMDLDHWDCLERVILIL